MTKNPKWHWIGWRKGNSLLYVNTSLKPVPFNWAFKSNRWEIFVWYGLSNYSGYLGVVVLTRFEMALYFEGLCGTFQPFIWGVNHPSPLNRPTILNIKSNLVETQCMNIVSKGSSTSKLTVLVIDSDSWIGWQWLRRRLPYFYPRKERSMHLWAR